MYLIVESRFTENYCLMSMQIDGCEDTYERLRNM